MTVWEAARCTSAAYPYFKPLKWDGKILLDGGYKLNCPAACANSEANSIWPRKHCDILLSLGTGTTPDLSSSMPNTLFGVAKTFFGDLLDAEKAWGEFMGGPLQKHRLNPVYHGTAFELDSVRKLNEIENQTERWIATQNVALTNICDHLIAALFFFRPMGQIRDGVQVGEILCRLPVDLEARQRLFEGMFLKTDSDLFAVMYNGKILARINNGALKDICPNAELCLGVRLSGLPTTGAIEVDVNMQRLGTHQPVKSSQWLPISGSPYVIREGPEVE